MTTRFSFAGGVGATFYDPGVALTADYNTSGDCVDAHGNCWLLGGEHYSQVGQVQVIDPSGTVLQTYSFGTIVSDICNYAAAHQTGGWVAGGSFLQDTGHALHVATISGTSYILFHVNKYQYPSNFWYTTMAILQPAADGTYSIAGMTWEYLFGVTSSYQARCYKIDLLGQKTLTDPVFVALGISATDGGPVFRIMPSISATLGIASGFNAPWYVWPGAYYNGGDTYNGLGLGQSLGVNTGADQSCFVMPNGSGGSDLMIYFSQTNMQGTGQAWVVANLQPTYPNGCLAKTTLPTPSYTLTTGTPSTSTVNLTDLTAVAGAFTYNGTAHDSLTDSRLYYDGSSGANGNAEYYAVPRLIETFGDGWLVGWYQPWFQDTSYTGANWTFKERLRLMTYSAATGKFTDAGVLQGSTAAITDIASPAGQPLDYMDVTGWALYRSGADLGIWHFNGPAATGSARWYVWRGGIGVETVGQVTVHTRIGASGSPRISAPINTALPSISGDAEVGETLTGDVGTWTGNP